MVWRTAEFDHSECGLFRTIEWITIRSLRACKPPIGRGSLRGESFFFTPPGTNQEGLPKTVEGPQTGQLHIVVRDDTTGKPTPCPHQRRRNRWKFLSARQRIR